MPISFRTLLVFLLFVRVTTSYCQSRADGLLESLVLQTQRHQSAHPYEKVHLHFDKPYYAIGDNIWFKAYVVQGEKNQPSNLSRIVYVDLINERDSVKQTLMLPLLVGLGWGNFTLSDNMKEGNYRVRAYTNWMRNFGQDYFFDKTIIVGNAITNNIITTINYTYSKETQEQKVTSDLTFKDINGNALAHKDISYEVQLGQNIITKGEEKTDDRGNLRISFLNNDPAKIRSGVISTTISLDEKRKVTKSFPVKATSNDIDVQFFPEGGDLVVDLASTVAFKAVGADGLGVPVRGYLTDQENNRILAFKSEHLGMGAFAFRPKGGTIYRALLQFENGTEKMVDLPAVQPKGYVLSVTSGDSENLRLNISSSPDLADQEVILLAQSNNKIYFASKSQLVGTRLTAIIPKSKFPQGILHITLFSTKNEPLAERVIFIKHEENLKIAITTPVAVFSKREKVQLSLNVTEKDNKPVLGSFSVAVVDETKVPYSENNETTILSNLLLTSDLKGYVESPNYYLTAIDENKTRHLDNLMLTHGWRRFAWREVLDQTDRPLAYHPERSISLSGTVTLSGKPVANSKVTVFYSHGKLVFQDTVTDVQGRFRFENLHFADSTMVTVQARSAKDRKDVKIQLAQIAPHVMSENKNAADLVINFAPEMVNYLKNSALQFDSLRRMGSGSIALQEVKIVDNKIEIPYSANLNGPGKADAVITGEKLIRCFDLRTCLENMVSGMVMRGGVPFLIRNLNEDPVLPMHVIVDGVDINEMDEASLAVINPDDVEAIEILKSAGNITIYGTKGRGGVLLITMKRVKSGDEKNVHTNTSGTVRVYQKGFYKVREFYSPDYSKPQVNPGTQDLRTTIYWNPQVITDVNGKAKLEFFNADGTGTHRIIVEGINEAGNIGRTVYRYEVK